MNDIKCCIYTRVFLDSPYINFFIEHYIKLGFDKIIILKADDYHYKFDLKYKSHIEVHEVKNSGDNMLSEHDYLIKNTGFDWVLSVDSDEFLLLHKKYKNNIKLYILKKYKENKNINTFYFRWGMIEKFDNNIVQGHNILNIYNVFQNTFIKSMVKIPFIKTHKKTHRIELNHPLHIYFENNILNDNEARSQQPITDNSYKESMLIHLHTRSVNNLIIKSFTSVIINKNMNNTGNFNNFIELIDNYKSYTEISMLLQQFKLSVGNKGKLPFSHTKKSPIRKCFLKKYTLNKYDNSIIDIDNENKILKQVLKMNNIDYTKYIEFIKNIHYFFE